MLSEELIVKIGADLEDLPLEPTSRRELSLLLSRVGGNIRAAQERGASYVQIAQQITASGYPIKPSTLRAGLDRQRKGEAGATGAPRRHLAKSTLTPVVRRGAGKGEPKGPAEHI
jgi:hypothetical protein